MIAWWIESKKKKHLREKYFVALVLPDYFKQLMHHSQTFDQ